MFKEKDMKQLKEKGIDVKEAEKQIEYLKKGFSFYEIGKSCEHQSGY